MGIRTRVSTIFKSNVNHLVTCAEDPEKIINQSIEEMEDSFDAAKKRVKGLRNEIEDSERYKKNILEQIDYWTKRTEEFVNGNFSKFFFLQSFLVHQICLETLLYNNSPN